MTSNNFDVEANNINNGDSRTGLDERGTQEVLEIMKRERVKYVLRLFLLWSEGTQDLIL